jgi:hypothetical protein
MTPENWKAIVSELTARHWADYCSWRDLPNEDETAAATSPAITPPATGWKVCPSTSQSRRFTGRPSRAFPKPWKTAGTATATETALNAPFTWT